MTTQSSFAWILFLSSLTTPLLATDYDVYYLGGQSNMDGYGFVRELDDEAQKMSSPVYIFHGNTSPDGAAVDGKGIWSRLQPGHGVGFQSNGKTNQYSDRFGVELSFARQLQEQFPDKKIALIKYSRGGTSIAEGAAGNFGCWDPDFDGVNQYDHFLATLRHAFAQRDIDGDGIDDRLIPAGIVWMQGESDAHYTEEIALAYHANLTRLMNLIRAALRQDDLPVVIGQISYAQKEPLSWKHGEIVRAAQAKYTTTDSAAALVTSTDKYGYSDPWHYDSAGYLDLGRQFAEAMAKLKQAQQKDAR